ncbi:HAUS augmin-like complex subunit 5 [Ictidomys tridecemlineatus]|uniref:HAUS augmin-like complex subunit 5 n=1 Tax=Ictidomys tridecemlineatus TaxID=43179 RepID=UPI000B54288E|nr:HAUS augmin-like complex subunit 5 [Ictidomys tridecemlineatus]KAG3255856.1 HAUS augmin-like complex subunit 5 [Ictidomys tridecemlineatus]
MVSSGHQDSPEVSRKLELEAAVARLRTEIQELDQNLELMEREAEAQDLAVEQMLQSTRDTQYRALLLRAQTGNLRRQQHGLRIPTQQLQNQLRRLQDIERWASSAQETSFHQVATHLPLRSQCSYLILYWVPEFCTTNPRI